METEGWNLGRTLIVLIAILIVLNLVARLFGIGFHISIMGSVVLTLLIWFIFFIFKMINR